MIVQSPSSSQEAGCQKIDAVLYNVSHRKWAGPSAQIMHVVPYSAEGPTIERLHKFVAEQGYKLRGRHHEIYFGDPRR